MAVDRRKKNLVWNVADAEGITFNDMRDGCALAVLMDIRDELQRLNSLLHCANFINIPTTLEHIRRKIPTRRRRRRA